MVKKQNSSSKALDWLLEPSNPGVRYIALRDIVKAGTKELAAAQKAAHAEGPIATILSKMNKEGFWEKPGAGYGPKYTSTVWSIILLGQLGASISIDKRIATACDYVLDHTLTKNGAFTVNGLLSGTVDCLQGNLGYSLLDMGCSAERYRRRHRPHDGQKCRNPLLRQ